MELNLSFNDGGIASSQKIATFLANYNFEIIKVLKLDNFFQTDPKTCIENIFNSLLKNNTIEYISLKGH
jgi:hypothetical protein